MKKTAEAKIEEVYQSSYERGRAHERQIAVVEVLDAYDNGYEDGYSDGIDDQDFLDNGV
jgi:hypothetical protein